MIDRQVDLLNSLLGRLRGGAGYVATVGSALFGAVAHSGSANAATMGSVAIPWMKRSNWPPHVAATLIAGNAGNGTVIPPSASFFILIGTATVAPYVSIDELLLAMFAAAAWCILWRLVVVFSFVRKHEIGRVAAADILPFGRSFRQGWSSLLVFLGIVIPVLVTLGPTGESLTGVLGEDVMESISIIVWIPVLLGLFAAALGWRRLPRSGREWYGFVAKTAPRYRDIGATLVFAFAGGAVLTVLGLAEQLSSVLNGLDASPVVMSIIVAVLVVLVAASTEGASPPGASAIYIATGIAQVNPVKTFVPLIVLYVLPILAIAALIGPGWLPVPH